jgi:hypothetical protein
MDDPVRTVLLYFIIPVWFLAGVADYLCHRASDIAHTAGWKESVLHLLMFGEVAVPLLMCLFLEVNALTFAVRIVAFLAHEATALWDVSFAMTQLLALFGFGSQAARFDLGLKPEPLPAAYVVAILAAALFLEFLPYVEELFRGLRARRATRRSD